MIKSTDTLLKRILFNKVLKTNFKINIFNTKYSSNLYKFQYCSFGRSSDIPLSNQDIKKKLKDKWEKKHGLMGGMPNLFSNKNITTVSINFDLIFYK